MINKMPKDADKHNTEQKQMANPVNVFFKTEYMPELVMTQLLKNRPNWHVVDESDIEKSQQLDFVFLDDLHYTKPKYYSLKCTAKNIVNDDKRSVSFKNNFVNHMMADPVGKKYIMPQKIVDLQGHLKNKSYLLQFKSLFDKKGVYIFKPVTGMSGKGIKVFDNYAGFVKYCNSMLRTHRSKWSRYKDPNKAPMRVWVLQEYLTDPLTVKKADGKQYKFHIRHYYLYQPHPAQSYYFDVGEIATARAPYVKGSWDNSKIHDTHFYEDDDELFPRFLNLSADRIADINRQLGEVYGIINSLNKSGCYPDSKYCFELFGVDIMLTRDYQVKIIEVNANPGNPFGNYMALKYNLFNDAFKLTVDKYLHTLEPIETDISTVITDTRSKGIKVQFIPINNVSTERQKAGAGTTDKKTYYVKTDYYTDDYIDSLFNTKHWQKITPAVIPKYIQSGKPIDYIYLDGKHYWDPKNFKLKSIVKNLVNEEKRSITAKNELMTNLTKIPAARKFIMPQLDIDLSHVKSSGFYDKIKSFMKPDTVYILKPVHGFSGQGIRMITAYDELHTFISSIAKKPADRISKKQMHWVLQEYLTEPLLIRQQTDNYKFHIRHYFFYVPQSLDTQNGCDKETLDVALECSRDSTIPGKTSYYTSDGEIAPARAPYVKGDWSNKLIHDTHFYGRDGELFPKALNLTPELEKDIYSQMAELYSHILSCIGAGCYAESKQCYELFGVDLILTADYKLKVIEVNEKIGMPSSLTPMTRILFEGCLNKIVMPMLGLSGNTKYDKHFIPINHGLNRQNMLKKVKSTKPITHKSKIKEKKTKKLPTH
jgi:hypothetical protein